MIADLLLKSLLSDRRFPRDSVSPDYAEKNEIEGINGIYYSVVFVNESGCEMRLGPPRQYFCQEAANVLNAVPNCGVYAYHGGEGLVL